jgi:hypothetical protein
MQPVIGKKHWVGVEPEQNSAKPIHQKSLKNSIAVQKKRHYHRID